MNPGLIRNAAITASAGCGKTEELAVRLIALLADPEIAPESIVTMTFTRAAAGEIYERVLTLLARALTENGGCEKLSARLPAGLLPDRAAVLALLEKTVRSMHILNIGTIDSFMSRMVQAFAVELGLPGTGQLLDEFESRRRRERTLGEVLAADASEDAGFIEYYREIAIGDESKQLFESCFSFLDEADRYALWRRHAEVWQRPRRLIEDNAPPAPALAAAWERAEQWFASESFPSDADRSRTPGWMSLLERCRDATVTTTFPREETAMLRSVFEIWDDFLAGNGAPAGFKKGYDYSGDGLRQAIAILLSQARYVLLLQAARRTGGIRQLLDEFYRRYDRNVILQGYLSFSDLTRILAESETASDEFRTEIDYRLNARFRHWLIDEFQDTSREQWLVLNRLIDGAQAPDQSLFLVGDVKQAIYGWRSGDSRLMKEVTASCGLDTSHALSDSFRYGPDIAGAINLLFGETAISRSALPEAVKRRWLDAQCWRLHRAAPSTRPGEFAVWVPQDDEESDLACYARLIDRKLKELDIQAGNLSCAILVRGRNDGIALKQALEELDPAWADRTIWEGAESIADDRLIAALTALLVYGQHPGDTASRELAMMLPAGRILIEKEKVLPELARDLTLNGFHGVLTGWLDRLARRGSGVPADDNLTALLTAALAFDAGGSRDAVDFRNFISGYRQSDNALGGKVRIMTIHHSKGLGFDVVFAAFCNSRHGSMRRMNLSGMVAGSHLSSEGEVIDWLLHSPRAEGGTIPDIRLAGQERFAGECFENLCVGYVALTRAKRGMYLLLPPPSRKKLAGLEKGRSIAEQSGESYYLSDFFHDTLLEYFTLRSAGDGPDYLAAEFGDPDWAGGLCGSGKSAGAPELPPPSPVPGVIRRRRHTPSEAHPHDAAELFNLPDPGRGAVFGATAHQFLAGVEWFEDFPEAEVPAALHTHWRNCRSHPLLCRPQGPAEVWRERNFEIILDGEWLTGSFDRVVIERGGDGRPERITLVDYKTDEVADGDFEAAAARYRRQLELYRAALMQMFGVSPERVQAWVLFTRYGRDVRF